MGDTRDPCHSVGHSTEIWVSIHMKESKMFNSQQPSFKFFHGMQNIPGDLSPLGDLFPLINVSSALVDSRKDCVFFGNITDLRVQYFKETQLQPP